MTASHWQVLFIYAGFTLVATVLALARRWRRPGFEGGGLWRKYPTYILMNLGFLFASWLPAQWHILTAVAAVLGALASWEISRALHGLKQVDDTDRAVPVKRSAETLFFRLLPLASFSLIAAAGWLDMKSWFPVWLAGFLFLSLLTSLTGSPGDYARRAAAMAASAVYLPLCLAAYLWIQKLDGTGMAAVFLYLTVATNDAMAQITGELFGARALVPQISPAKTVEGAAGGMLFAAAMGLALSSVIGWSYFAGALLGLILGMAALIGDLTASVWKRAMGLKNFSSLLGAQGGILDRFDGLIFAAPLFYLLIFVRH